MFDTQLLLWLLEGSPKLSNAAAAMIGDQDHDVLFSALTIAEIAIKRAKGYAGFSFEAQAVRRVLTADGCEELPLTGLHAARLADLPPIHKDPFNRLMVAQALAEGVPFVTADRLLAGYPGQIMVV